jgi:hypothetical protein
MYPMLFLISWLRGGQIDRDGAGKAREWVREFGLDGPAGGAQPQPLIAR